MRRLTTALRHALIVASFVLATPAPSVAEADAGGTITVRSAYPLVETVDRLKQDIARKGIRLFLVLDQTTLAGEAGAKLHPSVLLLFGNPALGARYVAAKPASGLDWPVRIVVFEKPKGEVFVAYTDFAAIARRNGIDERAEVFRIASGVVASIAGSIAAR